MRRLVAGFLLISAGLLAGASATAQNYPDHPVRLVIPFPAGSSTDSLGREVAQFMGTRLKQSFVSDNRPGALATIGTSEVARAKPDGYTLLLGTSTTHAAASTLFKKLPYDPIKDFTPIGRVGAVVFALAVRADLPVNTVQELIALGRQRTNKPLAWGYANSANQVAGSALVRYGQFEATAVPYKGVPQIVIDMMGKNIDFTIADLASIVPQVKAGKLKALAVTSSEETSQLPGVPPLNKTIDNFSLLGWYGLYAPANTPAPIVKTLSENLQKGLEDPDVQHRIEKMGLIPYPGNSDELERYTISEISKWKDLIEAAHIKPQ